MKVELGLKQSRSRTDSDQNLISMINIVFLLLIFFMIAGQLGQHQIKELQLPVRDTQQNVVQQQVQIQIDAAGRLYLNSEPAHLLLIEQHLRGLADAGESTADIQADKNLLAKELDALLTVVRNSGIKHIRLYTQNLRSV